MRKTLERLIGEVDDGVVIYPGHGDSFTMKEWKEAFPGFENLGLL